MSKPYVKDSVGNDVPNASVTVMRSDGIVTASGQTNMYGWVRLPVLSFIINASGGYYQGPHNVTAVYETYTNSTTVNVTENTQATVMLSEFVIPEFASIIFMVAAFAAATATTAAVCKNKTSRKTR